MVAVLLLERGPFHLVVPLQAHGAHLDAGVLQFLDQAHGAIALGRILHRIIVVIEFGFRVGLARVFEGLRDVVLADDLEPGTLAERAVFIERFVDHVPAADAALVAADHGRVCGRACA